MTPNRNNRIFKLAPYQRPAPQGDYFSDLPYEAQQSALRLLWKWCLGEADALPARRAGSARVVQAGRIRPASQSDGDAAQ